MTELFTADGDSVTAVTFDGSNGIEVLSVLGAVRGGVKFADHDEPGSPPNITAELADGTLLDVNVSDVVLKGAGPATVHKPDDPFLKIFSAVPPKAK